MALAKHIILDLYDCDIERIDSVEYIESALSEAVELVGCKILNKYFHKFSPQGVTGFICVCESHFSIHTWPEYGYCAIDIFCCKDGTEKSIDFLKKAFGSKHSITNNIDRVLKHED
jgi:S-adenosylmethionine decarboxylase